MYKISSSTSLTVPGLAAAHLLRMFNRIHHVAIICSNYEVSKHFYVDLLGLKVVQEVYREERKSYKLDLAVNDLYQIELFSFENPPKRTSRPEAAGLRHLAFEVDDIEATVAELNAKGIVTEGLLGYLLFH